MLCYKDQTYCQSDCTNKECHRFLSDEIKEGAQKRDLPIALCDFSKHCEEYESKTLEKHNKPVNYQNKD